MAGLKEYSEYNVSVSALNDAGMGPFSSQQLVMTLEDGKVNSYTIANCYYISIVMLSMELLLLLLVNCTAPSSPPRNVVVKAISSTSIQVSWLPPSDDNKNGVITGYVLWVNSSTDPTIHSLKEVQELTANITGRGKHYHYYHA